MESLVVLGTRADPHVELVVEKLRRHPGTEIFILDYNDDVHVSAEINVQGDLQLMVNGRMVQSFVVWDRRKIIPGTEFYVRGDEEYSGYIAQEWRALYTMIAGIAGDMALNTLKSRNCLIKPYQQMLAVSVGLQCPQTLVTNALEDALDFDVRSGGLILKSLSGAKIQTRSEGEYVPFNVMTMRISRDALAAADPASIACCPHFFQREIRKAYELRVVCVDDDMFAFRVDSQIYKSTEVDWRKAMDVIDFSETELDDALRSKLLAFMRKIRLCHGSIDLIVDKEGKTWFLECNQDGAWGWLDYRCNGKISDAISSSLLRRMSATRDNSIKTDEVSHYVA